MVTVKWLAKKEWRDTHVLENLEIGNIESFTVNELKEHRLARDFSFR